jgi:hypothetical protein
MTPVVSCYPVPSTVRPENDGLLIGLTADVHRPVSFRARVRERLLSLRLALEALGGVLWSEQWGVPRRDRPQVTMDPVVTVHPDRILIEAFRGDQSAYGLVMADRGLFEPEGETTGGSTTVDFPAWLWLALREVRSGRPAWLRIESDGFDGPTHGAGPFERTLDLPASWVQGSLRLQAALALPGTRLSARPVDLLTAVRHLQAVRFKGTPRALRYELEPGQVAWMILEPRGKAIPLKEAEHGGAEPRAVRTWGRHRLALIEPLLPFADSVDILLKGRALPSFYAVRLPGVTFVLGLTGWPESRWAGTLTLDVRTDGRLDEALLTRALDRLRECTTLSVDHLAEASGVVPETAAGLLTRLCRRGRAVYDVERREFRHREFFASPPDEAALFPPDPRFERARRYLAADEVRVAECRPRERVSARPLLRARTPDEPVPARADVARHWHVTGAVGEQPGVEVVVNDPGRLVFGACGCPESQGNAAPCAHQLALLLAADLERHEL